MKRSRAATGLLSACDQEARSVVQEINDSGAIAWPESGLRPSAGSAP